MIAANDTPPRLTPDQYLIWEENQPGKYEYIDGEVYAMGGGSVNHGRIAIRLTSLLEAHLEGGNWAPRLIENSVNDSLKKEHSETELDLLSDCVRGYFNRSCNVGLIGFNPIDLSRNRPVRFPENEAQEVVG